MITAQSPLPKGLSFEIADLRLVQRWTNLHGYHMSVHLDHGAEDEEYEELIAVHKERSRHCRWMMWRNAEAVFVQPIIGRRRQHVSVAAALDSLLPHQRLILTDIAATAWPT
jgi:hypothetical protein